MAAASDKSSDLTADEWPEFKALWFAIEAAAPEERPVLLGAESVTPRLRSHVEAMLDAADRVGVRFDKPAHITLGFDLPTPDSEAVPTLVGKRLGPFEVLRQVGRGGMGAVYEAIRVDAHYRQRVAIKTLWRGADSDILLQRFRSERQILAALQHPNIAQLLDGGAAADGTPWLAMEFVEGTSIDAYCDQNRLTLAARLDLFRQVCGAVHHAHQRLVVHRDLKPSNVMVTADGTVKLLDFGVAKLIDDAATDGTLTGAGLSPFTAAYAAPEQVTAAPTTTATDVYSLGALMVTLLAGAPPVVVTGLTPLERLTAVKEGAVRPPSVVARALAAKSDVNGAAVASSRRFADASRHAKALEGELDSIAMLAMRREPERRYASAEALSDDVRRYLRRDRVLARPDTVRYRVTTFVRQQRALVLAVTTAVLAVATAGVVALVQARSSRAEAERAERASSFLAGIVTGTGATARDPLIQIGPSGTIANLLDSALTRVPIAFAGDPKIRAQLYTAIGTNLAAQDRFGMARTTLDSARTLARQSYGVRSAEHATAMLELAALLQRFLGPQASIPLLREVAGAIGDEVRADPVLLAREQVLLGQQAMLLGRVAVADSLASAALRSAQRSARPTITRARAELLSAHASSWLRRDPRENLRQNRAALATTDSIGALLSSEHSQAVESVLSALYALGRSAEMTALAASERTRALEISGASPLNRASRALTESIVASARGDTAAYAAHIERSWTLMQEATEISPADALTLLRARIELLWSRKQYLDAVALAEQMSTRSRAAQAPLLEVFGALYLGIAYQMRGEPSKAEQAFRDGVAVVAVAPDLSSMLPRLRRPMADVVAAQGRAAEADSIRKLDPPRAKMPGCTPGGEWRGCPDQ